ncbi:MAG TPA: 3-hydroxybutyrate dehydrogenase [Patescibacteria group bacterium]|nr:3-hydroxybutyrate dehydrogenase [Patescibacteria group bacterium]
MLKGKTALVTGSTSGIGLGIARKLAQAGADIMLNGFGDAKEIEGIRAGIEKEFKVRVAYEGADVTKADQVKAMCEKAAKWSGAVDILVNNAGIQFVAPIQDFPPEKWDAILATNLTSAFHATRLCVTGMRKRGWGRIVNIASAHGLVASPFKSAYVSAKHGLVGFTKTIALETARDNITVNAICPGYVHTPLVDNQIKDQAKAHNMPENEVIEKVILEPQPTKKFVQIDDVAALTLFLCGDEAQGITGTALSIDGGWTAK